MNICIPDSMKAYVEAQAESCCFSSSSDYVNHLIRMDQERKTIERREKIAQYLALCEGQLARGEGKDWDSEKFLNEVEAEYKQQSKIVN